MQWYFHLRILWEKASGQQVMPCYHGISLVTTIGVRLIFSILFGIVLNLGVIGIALAMCLDWTVRGVIFWIRFRQGKWKTYRVIGE